MILLIEISIKKREIKCKKVLTKFAICVRIISVEEKVGRLFSLTTLKDL